MLEKLPSTIVGNGSLPYDQCKDKAKKKYNLIAIIIETPPSAGVHYRYTITYLSEGESKSNLFENQISQEMDGMGSYGKCSKYLGKEDI